MKTQLSPEFRRQVENIDLSIQPFDGVKEQYLQRYQGKLATTTGVRPTFDKMQKELLLKYDITEGRMAAEIDYLNNLQDEVGYFGRSYKSYSKMEEALKRFAEHNYTSFRWCKTYQLELQRLKDYYGQFKSNVLTYNSDDDVIRFLPKTDTSSGFTKLESGFASKGENKEGVYQRLLQLEEKSIESGSMDRPILISHRSQASGEYDDDNNRTNTFKRKVRVVSMVDMLQIAEERRFQKGIQDVLALLDSYAGGYSLEKIGQCISTWRNNYSYYVSVDYSSFDQTISNWLIEDAFSILEQMINFNNERDKALWRVVINSFIHKDFVVAEGLIHSDKGVPSGSMFTQIIDSIVNQLVVGTYFQSLGIKEFDMMIMGDDNIIFTKEQLDNEAFASYLRKNFGLEVNASKFDCGSVRKDPKFLSVIWSFQGRWRPPYEVLSRILFPERFRIYVRTKIKDGIELPDMKDWSDERVEDWYSRNSVDVAIMDPRLVLYCYILTYPLAMASLIDVRSFLKDSNLNLSELNHVDNRYLTGLMAYIRSYG